MPRVTYSGAEFAESLAHSPRGTASTPGRAWLTAPVNVAVESALRIAVVGDGPLARRLVGDLTAAGHSCGALADDGPLDACLFAPWDPAHVTPVTIDALTDAEFAAAWQDTLDAAIDACVRSRTRFGTDGGRLVFVIPTIAMAGGARYGHWAAAAEGVHQLAKSAARQWGPEGITANVLAVGPADVLADPAVAGPVSIAAPALPSADPVAVAAFLCGPGAAHLGGQTLVVDGGTWM